MTPHVVYLADVLARTIAEDMRNESRYLQCHARARAAIKDIVEMPDLQADRIIRSIDANRGKLSNVLLKELPLLGEEGVWEAMVQAVEGAFEGVAGRTTSSPRVWETPTSSQAALITSSRPA